jgi:hypothetical protein
MVAGSNPRKVAMSALDWLERLRVMLCPCAEATPRRLTSMTTPADLIATLRTSIS